MTGSRTEAISHWLLPEGVTPLSAVSATVGEGVWPFERAEAAAIENHWQQALRHNPRFFNGTIYMMARMALNTGPDGPRLDTEFIPVAFKSFLYWKHVGEPSAGAFDAFGSALLIGTDGALVLGRQRDGNINAGLLYLPGGFIDPRDVEEHGAIDVAGSVAREIEEETGLVVGRDVTREAGFIATRVRNTLSIAVPHRAHVPASALADQVRSNLAGDADSELIGVEVIARRSDLSQHAMPDFARRCAEHVLEHGLACDGAPQPPPEDGDHKSLG